MLKSPNAWAVTAPPNDILIRDWKETVYAYLKKSRVPYTIIDIGVWHEVAIPRVTSGKLDRAALMGRTFLVGEKGTRCATAAVYIALAREITGEDVPYIPVSEKKVLELAHLPETAYSTIWQKVIVQYLYNNWVRGDNEASYAKYLGYLDAHDLYPEIQVKSLKESMQEAFANGQDFADQVGDDSFWLGLEELLCEVKN
ncbi:hypothetical protein PENSTE_c017G07295 [Penicillium steckii]|uniref:NmrA-like domain-containing protein n=1 Tax=Penicillium steckii TaxID=303698 RepID=A0A1V6SYK5_9EURO|nr:hypothetical protein PENSTE_c017G07295 [Penicillium steckii]